MSADTTRYPGQVLLDGEQYVTAYGNDTDDGWSFGTAKATVAAALATLPSGNTTGTAGYGRVVTSASYAGTITQVTGPSVAVWGPMVQSTATPATNRNVWGRVALTYAGSVTIGSGSGNACGVRGDITVKTGTTLASGYAFGVQGKAIVNGVLTTQSGGGIVCGVQGQLNAAGATMTNAGLTGAGWFDIQDGPAATVTNVKGIILTNSSTLKAGAAIHIGTTSAGFANVLSIDDTSNGCWSTAAGTTAGANPVKLNVIIGASQKYILAADGWS